MAGVPTFKKIIKRQHTIYSHKEISPVLNYLIEPNLPRGALAKISRDIGIPH
jgi:hypothetical protein